MLGGNSSSEVRLFPEDNLHAPDESFSLDILERGAATGCSIRSHTPRARKVGSASVSATV